MRAAVRRRNELGDVQAVKYSLTVLFTVLPIHGIAGRHEVTDEFVA